MQFPNWNAELALWYCVLSSHVIHESLSSVNSLDDIAESSPVNCSVLSSRDLSWNPKLSPVSQWCFLYLWVLTFLCNLPRKCTFDSGISLESRSKFSQGSGPNYFRRSLASIRNAAFAQKIGDTCWVRRWRIRPFLYRWSPRTHTYIYQYENRSIFSSRYLIFCHMPLARLAARVHRNANLSIFWPIYGVKSKYKSRHNWVIKSSKTLSLSLTQPSTVNDALKDTDDCLSVLKYVDSQSGHNTSKCRHTHQFICKARWPSRLCLSQQTTTWSVCGFNSKQLSPHLPVHVIGPVCVIM